ncbi:hypothetical protein BGZ63DRAFT_136055 [Mariannaea sp. PMI_226]|nr:hypothetical protein BGZ63DRAFT_136055 [Mariannaea sp. PMI_226]
MMTCEMPDRYESHSILTCSSYIVEEIEGHYVDKNETIFLKVKWEGYEEEDDRTWEPEDNLTYVLSTPARCCISQRLIFFSISGNHMLEKYYDGFGGRAAIIEQSKKAAHLRRQTPLSRTLPAQPPSCSKGGKKHLTDEVSSAAPKHWSPPSGSWEDEMVTINACDVGSNGKLVIYLAWENGAKTKHDAQTIYGKCPQKMLLFYERHIQIVKNENKSQGEGASAA